VLSICCGFCEVVLELRYIRGWLLCIVCDRIVMLVCRWVSLLMLKVVVGMIFVVVVMVFMVKFWLL